MSRMQARRSLEKMRRALRAFTEEAGLQMPQRERRPVRRHVRLPTWDDALAEHVRPHSLATAYEWADPLEVPRLLREGGNPYLAFWTAADGSSGHWSLDHETIPPMFADEQKLMAALPWVMNHRMTATVATGMARSYAVQFYAWAVPDEEALKLIAELDQPVLDLGSGRGYWAWQLEQRGVRVLAEEPERYAWHWRRPDRSNAERSLPRDHALLFCWPTYADRWAYHRLREYQGDTVIYIGEHGGCTAEALFHQLLDERFAGVGTVAIPSWDGIHDQLYVYRRK